jgi:hypothetical protein
MLIALFLMLLLGGTPSGMLVELSLIQENIKEVVAKDDRQNAAGDVVKKMETRTKALKTHVEKDAKRLGEALSDHDFPTVEIDKMWSKYHALTLNYRLRMVDLRFELKEHITREEWQEIFGRAD